MVGQKVNARGKLDGSPMDTLKDENVFLQAKLLKSINIF